MAKRKIDFTLRDYWNQDSLLLYKEAVSRYPYCAPARLSFLLNLRALDDPDYERELSFTALAVPDRQRLQEEVRAAEQAAAVLRERGERRMRQVAARWAAASATTAALGRLMKTDGAAPAETADGVVMASDAVSAVAVTPAPESASASGREVDFKAVAANEPGLRMAADAAMADAAAVSGGALDDAASGAEGTASADWMEEYPSARSRSSRRNARRMARREAQKAAEREAAAAMRTAEAVGVAEAAQVAVGAVAESALEAAAAPRTISMLWAEAPAAAPHVADAPRATPRHRPEAFNPWAEVFTAKHTISDWLQAGEATDAPDTPDVSDAGASAGSASAAGPDAASMRPVPARKPVSAGKKPAPARKPAPAVKPAPTAKPEVEPVASVSATKPTPSQTPSPAPNPAPDYIDPNELIDRFLRKNDDHILIQVDETRDYSAFDPDRGSLREDWSMGSETLAQLYLKQGAPDKAIEIYRYLGLKFPEKKRYFAGLIRAAENTKGQK